MIKILLRLILRRCRKSSQGSNPSHVIRTSNLPMSRDRIDVVKVIEHPVGGGNATISIPNNNIYNTSSSQCHCHHSKKNIITVLVRGIIIASRRGTTKPTLTFVGRYTDCQPFVSLSSSSSSSSSSSYHSTSVASVSPNLRQQMITFRQQMITFR
jgi:hypothetical protein